MAYVAQYMLRIWTWTCTLCGHHVTFRTGDETGSRSRVELEAQSHYLEAHSMSKRTDFFEVVRSQAPKWYVE